MTGEAGTGKLPGVGDAGRMVATLVRAVENPAKGVKVVEVLEIRS